MRQVPIKQLYKALSKELDDLPFTITKKGVAIAIVLGRGLDEEQEKGLDKTRKSRPSKVDNKAIELALKWTGGYSKDQQTRKKGKK